METTVLVVDDEVSVRWSAVNNLEELGYRVLEAATAKEAMTLLENFHDISLVFTDIRMPGTMDGVMLAEAIREKWPSVKLVVTSGLPLRETLPDGITYVQKPYSPIKLDKVFSEMLG